MKLQIFKIVFFIMFCATGQEYTFMSYNIKLDYPKEGENNWKKRLPFLSSQILFTAPDVLGIQEALLNQMKDLDSILANYAYVGVGRDDGKKQGEFSSIFYNKKKLSILKSSTFWLAETPQKVSKGWDAAYNRVCTHALFKDQKTGIKFWVFNTHLDHVGIEAREQSVKLILSKIKELNSQNLPLFLMGDFNLEPQENPIQTIKQTLIDSKEKTMLSFGVEATFNGFEFNKPATRRIDYIFCNSKVKIQKYAVMNNHNNGFYPSDHFPVIIEATLKNRK